MSSSLTLLVILLSLCLGNQAQRNDEQDLPPERQQAPRTSKASFDGQYSRGRCPEKFIQLGDECLFFSNEGKTYAWSQVKHACRRIARLLNQPGASPNINQPNMTPARGVRQLVLNTPAKTELLQAYFREYNEQNFAVHLPDDYSAYQRCQDGKDDKWPRYCSPQPPASNRSCLETISIGPGDICLREVDCNEGYLRFACEFTLPGSAELTNSRFRHCPKRGGFFRRLPKWAWISIIVGGSLLLLIILAVIIGVVLKSRKGGSSKKRSLPVPRQPEEKIVRVLPKREDPTTEPMLPRVTPETDTGYLQPRSTPINPNVNV